MDDFRKYERMKADGVSPVAVYGVARTDGVDPITRIRLLRHVFCLLLVQAKEVTISAATGKSLDEYQAGLAESIEHELNKIEQKESV